MSGSDWIESWIENASVADWNPEERPTTSQGGRQPKRRRLSSSLSKPIDRVDSAHDAFHRMNNIDQTPPQLPKRTSQASGSPSKKARSVPSESSASSASAAFVSYQDLPEPIEVRQYQRQDIPTSFGTRDLFDTANKFILGLGTVGESLLAELRSMFPDRFDFDLSGTLARPGDHRLLIGAEPTLSQIDLIVEHAVYCSKREVSEAAWNTQVHSQVLSLAVSLSKHRKTIGFVNVTVSRGNPRFKVEQDGGVCAFGKLVDFALILHESRNLLENHHKLLLERNGTRHYNHTLTNSLAHEPISVSIETKVEGEGQKHGRRQLIIWVAMHYRRLEALARSVPERAGTSEIDLPCLPLLFVQGGTWHYLLAKRQGKKTTIYDKQCIGDVKDVHGLLKVLGVLLLLMDWSQQKFRPWLEELMEQMAHELPLPSTTSSDA